MGFWTFVFDALTCVFALALVAIAFGVFVHKRQAEKLEDEADARVIAAIPRDFNSISSTTAFASAVGALQSALSRIAAATKRNRLAVRGNEQPDAVAAILTSATDMWVQCHDQSVPVPMSLIEVWLYALTMVPSRARNDSIIKLAVSYGIEAAIKEGVGKTAAKASPVSAAGFLALGRAMHQTRGDEAAAATLQLSLVRRAASEGRWELVVAVAAVEQWQADSDFTRIVLLFEAAGGRRTWEAPETVKPVGTQDRAQVAPSDSGAKTAPPKDIVREHLKLVREVSPLLRGCVVRKFLDCTTEDQVLELRTLLRNFVQQPAAYLEEVWPASVATTDRMREHRDRLLAAVKGEHGVCAPLPTLAAEVDTLQTEVASFVRHIIEAGRVNASSSKVFHKKSLEQHRTACPRWLAAHNGGGWELTFKRWKLGMTQDAIVELKKDQLVVIFGGQYTSSQLQTEHRRLLAEDKPVRRMHVVSSSGDFHFNSDLKLPGVSLTITCATVDATASRAPTSHTVTINLSGKHAGLADEMNRRADGEPPRDGSHGKAGDAGGWLEICGGGVERCLPHLIFVSNGGNGSDGLKGDPGDVGHPGTNGKDCPKNFYDFATNRWPWCRALTVGFGIQGAPPGRGTPNGASGRGGPGGPPGRVFLIDPDWGPEALETKLLHRPRLDHGRNGKMPPPADAGLGGEFGNAALSLQVYRGRQTVIFGRSVKHGDDVILDDASEADVRARFALAVTHNGHDIFQFRTFLNDEPFLKGISRREYEARCNEQRRGALRGETRTSTHEVHSKTAAAVDKDLTREVAAAFGRTDVVACCDNSAADLLRSQQGRMQRTTVRLPESSDPDDEHEIDASGAFEVAYSRGRSSVPFATRFKFASSWLEQAERSEKIVDVVAASFTAARAFITTRWEAAYKAQLAQADHRLAYDLHRGDLVNARDLCNRLYDSPQNGVSSVLSLADKAVVNAAPVGYLSMMSAFLSQVEDARFMEAADYVGGAMMRRKQQLEQSSSAGAIRGLTAPLVSKLGREVNADFLRANQDALSNVLLSRVELIIGHGLPARVTRALALTNHTGVVNRALTSTVVHLLFPAIVALRTSARRRTVQWLHGLSNAAASCLLAALNVEYAPFHNAVRGLPLSPPEVAYIAENLAHSDASLLTEVRLATHSIHAWPEAIARWRVLAALRKARASEAEALCIRHYALKAGWRGTKTFEKAILKPNGVSAIVKCHRAGKDVDTMLASLVHGPAGLHQIQNKASSVKEIVMSNAWCRRNAELVRRTVYETRTVEQGLGNRAKTPLAQVGKYLESKFSSKLRGTAGDTAESVAETRSQFFSSDIPLPLSKVLGYLCHAWALTHGGQRPRDLQLVASVALLTSPDPMLAEIASGEGKTLVVAFVAAVNALLGHPVDIATSTPDNARAGANEANRFFNAVLRRENAAVSCVYSTGEMVPGAFNSIIVYADSVALRSVRLHFEADDFEPPFMDGVKARTKRRAAMLIIDEFDAVALSGYSDTLFMARTHWETYQLLPTLGVLYNAARTLSDRSPESAQALEDHMRKYLRSEESQLPTHLRTLALEALPTWVDAAMQLDRLRQGVHYAIVTGEDHVARVEPFDQRAGVERRNTAWMNAVAQLLHIRHGLQVDPEQLVSQSVTCGSWIETYGKRMVGVSGTLGLPHMHDTCRKLYGVTQLVQFMPSQPHEVTHEVLVSGSRAMLPQRIAEHVIKKLERQPVLVITETPASVRTVAGEVRSLLSAASDNGRLNGVRVYELALGGGDNPPLEFTERCVLVATNRGGRGMDLRMQINTSRDRQVLNELHVVLAEPSDHCTTRQAESRTARNGARGSITHCVVGTPSAELDEHALLTRALVEKEEQLQASLALSVRTDRWRHGADDIIADCVELDLVPSVRDATKQRWPKVRFSDTDIAAFVSQLRNAFARWNRGAESPRPFAERCAADDRAMSERRLASFFDEFNQPWRQATIIERFDPKAFDRMFLGTVSGCRDIGIALYADGNASATVLKVAEQVLQAGERLSGTSDPSGLTPLYLGLIALKRDGGMSNRQTVHSLLSDAHTRLRGLQMSLATTQSLYASAFTSHRAGSAAASMAHTTEQLRVVELHCRALQVAIGFPLSPDRAVAAFRRANAPDAKAAAEEFVRQLQQHKLVHGSKSAGERGVHESASRVWNRLHTEGTLVAVDANTTDQAYVKRATTNDETNAALVSLLGAKLRDGRVVTREEIANALEDAQSHTSRGVPWVQWQPGEVKRIVRGTALRHARPPPDPASGTLEKVEATLSEELVFLVRQSIGQLATETHVRTSALPLKKAHLQLGDPGTPTPFAHEFVMSHGFQKVWVMRRSRSWLSVLGPAVIALWGAAQIALAWSMAASSYGMLAAASNDVFASGMQDTVYGLATLFDGNFCVESYLWQKAQLAALVVACNGVGSIGHSVSQIADKVDDVVAVMRALVGKGKTWAGTVARQVLPTALRGTSKYVMDSAEQAFAVRVAEEFSAALRTELADHITALESTNVTPEVLLHELRKQVLEGAPLHAAIAELSHTVTRATYQLHTSPLRGDAFGTFLNSVFSAGSVHANAFDGVAEYGSQLASDAVRARSASQGVVTEAKNSFDIARAYMKELADAVDPSDRSARKSAINAVLGQLTDMLEQSMERYVAEFEVDATLHAASAAARRRESPVEYQSHMLNNNNEHLESLDSGVTATRIALGVDAIKRRIRIPTTLRARGHAELRLNLKLGSSLLLAPVEGEVHAVAMQATTANRARHGVCVIDLQWQEAARGMLAAMDDPRVRAQEIEPTLVAWFREIKHSRAEKGQDVALVVGLHNAALVEVIVAGNPNMLTLEDSADVAYTTNRLFDADAFELSADVVHFVSDAYGDGARARFGRREEGPAADFGFTSAHVDSALVAAALTRDADCDTVSKLNLLVELHAPVLVEGFETRGETPSRAMLKKVFASDGGHSRQAAIRGLCAHDAAEHLMSRA